jgi:hypothetical protein
MAVIVIGGQSRNVGKTGVVCAILRAMPEMAFTAIKITHHRHIPGMDGEEPGGRAPDRFTVSEERDPGTGSDSSRYLAAGAAKALFIQASSGDLADAMPFLRSEIDLADHVILESNRIVEQLGPTVYVLVCNPEVGDFKTSARSQLHAADALVLTDSMGDGAVWPTTFPAMPSEIPRFHMRPPDWHSPEFMNFIAERMQQAGH